MVGLDTFGGAQDPKRAYFGPWGSGGAPIGKKQTYFWVP